MLVPRMGGMLRMVCKMLRMSLRGTVRMYATSGVGSKIVMRSAAEAASAKGMSAKAVATKAMSPAEAVPSSEAVAAAGPRFSDARTRYH